MVYYNREIKREFNESRNRDRTIEKDAISAAQCNRLERSALIGHNHFAFSQSKFPLRFCAHRFGENILRIFFANGRNGFPTRLDIFAWAVVECCSPENCSLKHKIFESYIMGISCNGLIRNTG